MVVNALYATAALWLSMTAAIRTQILLGVMKRSKVDQALPHTHCVTTSFVVVDRRWVLWKVAEIAPTRAAMMTVGRRVNSGCTTISASYKATKICVTISVVG